MKIVTISRPGLRSSTRRVTNITGPIKALMLEMLEKVVETDAVGIAAPQLGFRLKAVLVWPDRSKNPLFMFNPEVVWASAEETELDEGCLSVPGARVKVRRPSRVVVTYLDEGLKVTTRTFANFIAKVVQHEIDHINGILIVDKK